jgi:tRNA(fMet)-specific endonuclease VapC
MILLDTDHLSVLSIPGHSNYDALSTRMRAARDETFAVAIISVEEQLRGWLAKINRLRDARHQVAAYDLLADLLDFLEDWEIVRFDARAADAFRRLREQKVRIGSADLKIAAVALTRGTLLLSANLRDFRQVPGLRVEIWIDD